MTLRDGRAESFGWVRLDWDSDHFGISIGRILFPAVSEVTLAKALRSADAAGIRCLYWLIDFNGAQVAIGQRAGFKKVDVRVELEADLGSQPLSLGETPGIRQAVESDLDPLKALASRSHRNTRFYADRSFPPRRSDALYAEWIGKSVQDPSQKVFVSGPPGLPNGYIAFGMSGTGIGVIGLIAVEESQRGTGLGSTLVRAALSRLRAQGAENVTVVTQTNNQAAQRLYGGLGFKERNRSVWLHRWQEE